MLSKPNNMSRRGFLRNVLGITAAIILPAPQLVVRPEWGPSPLIPYMRQRMFPIRPADRIRGVRHNCLVVDDLDEAGINPRDIEYFRDRLFEGLGIPAQLRPQFEGTPKRLRNRLGELYRGIEV